MFHLPNLFCDTSSNGFRPTMHFVNPAQSFRRGHCHSEARPRCRRQCSPGAIWHAQPTQCCEWPVEGGCDETDVFDFLQPLIASLGASGGFRMPHMNQRYPHGKRSRCPEFTDFQLPEGFTENILSSVFDHLINNEGKEMETNADNSLSNIIQQALGAWKTSGSLKWQHQIDCSGFKSDNIFVRIVRGELVVKAAKKETCCDGSVSMKSMEKRIPLPRDVIAKKISCKMMPNSILKIEGPRQNCQKSENGNSTGRKPNASKKEDSENKEYPDFDAKVLPNGGMMFTLFPGLNNAWGDMAESNSGGVSLSTSKTAGKEHGDGNSQDEKSETSIPVQFVTKSHSASKENSQSMEKTICQEPNSSKQALDSEVPRAVEECPCGVDVINEETVPMTADFQFKDAAQKESECPNIDRGDSYTVELAESEEDAASIDSKDSENSFVLLTEQETTAEGTHKENEISDIADANLEITESQPSEEKNDSEEKSVDETHGAKQINDITKLITNTIPSLQSFIVNMNSPNKPAQSGMNDVQNAAKIVSEALPNLKNFITPKMGTTGSNNASENSKRNMESTRIQGKEFNVRLEMPLCNPESIHVTMDDEQRLLHIIARKEGSRDKGSSGEITKSIEVPHSVNVSQLRCQFRDGLLNINAPYKEGTKSTRDIPVHI